MLKTRLRSLRYIFPALGICLLASMASAQVDSLAEMPDGIFAPELVSAKSVLPAGGVEVPMEDRLGTPVVEVMINGHGPFRLGIETGAATLVLEPNVAKEIGVDSLKGTPAFRVDSLAIGGARFLNVTGVKTDSLGGMDGLLGLNVFYNVLLTVDYAAKRVRLTSDSLPPVNNRDILQLQRTGGLIYAIEIGVDAGSTLALLDTQNECAFIVTPAYVADTQFVVAPEYVGPVGGPAIGKRPRKRGRWNGTIKIANTVFQQPLVDIVQIPFKVLDRWNIGWPTLKQFVMSLDQRTGRIRLLSQDTVVSTPAERSFVGLDIRDSTIHMVGPEKIAERQGIKVGDVVVSIDDKPYAEWTSEQRRERFRKGTPIRMVVRREGVVREIVLTKEILVE